MDDSLCVPATSPLSKISSKNPVLQNSWTFLLPVAVAFFFLLLVENSSFTLSKCDDSELDTWRSCLPLLGVVVRRTVLTARWKKTIACNRRGEIWYECSEFVVVFKSEEFASRGIDRADPTAKFISKATKKLGAYVLWSNNFFYVALYI